MLVILDFDGVIRSTSWRALMEGYDAIFAYARKNRADFYNNLTEFQRWFNADWRVNLERISTFTEKEIEEICVIFHNIYDQQVFLFPWSKKILTQLHKKHQLALLSSSSTSTLLNVLGSLCNFFSLILGPENTTALKPDPEGIYIAMKKLSAKPENTLIVGDMPVDILAGKNAGIKTGAVSWGGLSKWEKLLALKPDYKFRTPHELANI